MKELLNIFRETKLNPRLKEQINNNKVVIRYNDGAIVETVGDYSTQYKIEFINADTNIIEYSTNIFNNCWANTNKKYFYNWLIRVYENNQLIVEDKFDPTGKNVVIRFESSAIGDTIAWLPAVEEFRKKWNCEVFVSTFNNAWFVENYPEIHFMHPGFNLDNSYADYKIGWFYKDNNIVNYDRNPIDFKRFPLQETPTSILGLDYKEIKPKITFPYRVPNIYDKYVVIAPHASAHAKYWNTDQGWQIVIDHLNSIGYKVILIGTEKLGDPWHDSKLGGTLKNVVDKTGDIAIQDRMVDIRYASLFIGVGSGLSWLSWALGTKTMLISGFSEEYTEFSDCIRIGTTEKYACHGCFNNHRLDAGDWEWCPEHKNTPRMFECTKTIKPETVINEINKVLLLENIQ